MSLDIRYLTNGTKNVYVVVDKVLYPDLMKERCSLPEFVGLPCIFESCQLCWQACKGRYTEAGA